MAQVVNSGEGRGTIGTILLAVFVGASIIVVLLIIGGISGSCEREEPEYIPDTAVWAETDLRASGPAPAPGEYQLYDVYIVGSIKNNTEEPMDYHIEIVKRRARYNRYEFVERYVGNTRETVGTVDLAQVRPGEKVSWEVMIYKQAKPPDISPDREYAHDHFQVFVNGNRYGMYIDDDICLAM